MALFFFSTGKVHIYICCIHQRQSVIFVIVKVILFCVNLNKYILFIKCLAVKLLMLVAGTRRMVRKDCKTVCMSAVFNSIFIVRFLIEKPMLEISTKEFDEVKRLLTFEVITTFWVLKKV